MSYVAVAAIAVGVIGAGIAAYSTYSQGQAQRKQSAYNALIAQQNANLAAKKAEMTRTATELEAERFRKQTKAFKAAQQVGYAKAGVQMAGTPVLTAAETQRQADIDELAIRYAGSVELSNVLAEQARQEQTAVLMQMQGKQASRAGSLGAGASLLTGLGQAGTNYYFMKNR